MAPSFDNIMETDIGPTQLLEVRSPSISGLQLYFSFQVGSYQDDDEDSNDVNVNFWSAFYCKKNVVKSQEVFFLSYW